MSTSWLLGNVYTAKYSRAKNEILTLSIGTSQLRETTLTVNIGSLGYPGVGRGADNLTLEKTCHEI
jgi:hypothetical protein